MKLSELLEELNLLYSGFCKGLTAEECHALLPAINQQYIDYIRWKLQMLASPEGEAHLAYLRRLLAGELPVLNLPTDRPRPPVQTYNTASHLKIAIRIIGVDDLYCNPRIAAHVLVFDAPSCTVHQQVSSIKIDPNGGHLGTAIFHQGCQVGKGAFLE